MTVSKPAVSAILDEVRRVVALGQCVELFKDVSVMESKSRFDEARSALKQATNDTRFKDALDALKQEQADLEALASFRDRIASSLRERKGEKIKLAQWEGFVADKQADGQLGLKVSAPGGGSVEMNVPLNMLSLNELAAYAPPPKTPEELRLSAYWLLIQNKEAAGLEAIQKAQDAGLSVDQADAFRLRVMAFKADPAWKLLRHGDELVVDGKYAALEVYRQLDKSLVTGPLKTLLSSKIEKRMAYVGAMSQPGIEVVYFNDITLTSEALQRIEPKVGFETNDPTLDPKIRRNDVSIRWTGLIKSPKPGLYEFTLIHDDGARLWINDKLVFDEWGRVHTDKASIEMTDKPISIKLEFFNSVSEGYCRFRWKGPGENQEVEIPASAYSHIAAPPKP